VAAPSLYRRHRPRTFADVVGQEHVVRTLRNAVQRNRVHHAYLFVGSRGTGKTSMAKILAACLNCERGPTIEPDGTCPSCVAIANATSLDVIEMDAASNNSVDDVRDLRERVAYAPVSGRHKVYILDEAHMLSPQAWNAFLKTLEEPPPNTVFVLATTEAQKVLPTVVDRCHRFDFARPGAEQVATVLRRVAEQEAIDLPETALRLIARSATGSFRDALGTLEQLTTYAGTGEAGGRIALEDVLAVLGVADADLLLEAADAVVAGDPRAALEVAARVASTGRDPAQFLRDLEAHVRDLLVVGLVGEVPAELRLTPERDERLLEQAGALPRGEVIRLLELIAAAQENLRNGGESRTQLELALVKAASPQGDASTRALLARIDRLEAGLGAAPAADPPTAPAPPVVATEAPPPDGPAPDPALAAGAAVSDARQPSSPPPSPPLSDLWPAVVDAVRPVNGMVAAIAEAARPVELEGDELVVAFPPDAAFFKRKVESEDHRRVVADAVAAVAGRPLRVRYELREVPTGPGGAGAPAVDPDELIRRVVAEFDAEEIPADKEADP
jgi:DNA polymerase-3 subunit gamma/tau